MKIRSISLVRDLALQFQGNLYPNAIAVGDVDHDQGNELVVGTLDGFLYIYKIGTDSPLPSSTITHLPNLSTLPYQPWKTCSGLGTITTVTVGDIRNIGKDSIIVINAEGGCYLFDYPFNSLNINVNLADNQNHTPTAGLITSANWSTSLPANTLCSLIADVDGDGIKEFVIASTSRTIHCYQLTAQVSQSAPMDKTGKGEPRGMRVYTGRVKAADYSVLFWLTKNHYKVDNQITSLSVGKDEDNCPLLIVGQGGESYLTIDEDGRINKINELGPKPAPPTPALTILSEKGFNQVATITEDGLLSIDEIKSDPNKLFKKNIENIIQCSIPKQGHIVGYGNLNHLKNQVKQPTTAIAWGDGTTLFFDSKGQGLSRFDFPKAPVAAFLTGQFAVQPNVNTQCLFYVSFQGNIHVYSEPKLNYLSSYKLDPFQSQLLDSGEMKELENILDTLCDALINKVNVSPAPTEKDNSNTTSPKTNKKKKKKKKKKSNPAAPSSGKTPGAPSPLPTLLETEPLDTLSLKQKRAMIYQYILYHELPRNNISPVISPTPTENNIKEKGNKVKSISLPNTSKMNYTPLLNSPINSHSPINNEDKSILGLQLMFSPVEPKLAPWDLNWEPFE